MPDTHVGAVLSLEGFWKWMRSMAVNFPWRNLKKRFRPLSNGIEKYLGSGLIKGIGPKFAKRIVQKFGKDTLDVIEEKPESLIQVEGIGKIRVERIQKSWQEQKEIKNIMLFLQDHGVSTSHATKIFKPTAATVLAWSEKIPTGWRMISGVSGLKRRIGLQRSWVWKKSVLSD